LKITVWYAAISVMIMEILDTCYYYTEIYHWCTANLTEGTIKEAEKVIYLIVYTNGTVGNFKGNKLMQQCISVEIFWSKGQYTCIDQHCCLYAGRMWLLLSRFLLSPLFHCTVCVAIQLFKMMGEICF
jgi:hypothetical protein